MNTTSKSVSKSLVIFYLFASTIVTALGGFLSSYFLADIITAYTRRCMYGIEFIPAFRFISASSRGLVK